MARLRESEQEAVACATEVSTLDEELADLKAQLLHLQDRSKHIRVNADMRDVKLRAELTRLEERKGAVAPEVAAKIEQQKELIRSMEEETVKLSRHLEDHDALKQEYDDLRRRLIEMKALGLHKSFAKVSRDRATLAEGFRVAKLAAEHDISSLEAGLQNAIAERDMLHRQLRAVVHSQLRARAGASSGTDASSDSGKPRATE